MISLSNGGRIIARAICAALLISVFTMAACPPLLCGDENCATVLERFDEASKERALGHYDRAIEIYQGIMIECSKPEDFIRRAYNEMVFTLTLKADEQSALAVAHEALSRFPDLTAPPMYCSPRVNEIYESLRRDMFGSLEVATRPDSCRVFLGGEFKGVSPLHIEYVPVGDYFLNASRSGYRDDSTHVRISPASVSNVALRLEQPRSLSWWSRRLGPPVGTSVGVAAIILHGVLKGSSKPSPLPGPPLPPD
jgi:hypothetical protein